MDHIDRPLFGLALRLAGIALVSTGFMLVKYTGESGVSLVELVFFRQLLTLPLLLGLLGVTGQLHRLRTARLASHARRAVTGMGGMICSFAALILLPLAMATTLSFTAPLFAVVLTAIFQRERVGPWRWGAVALGFIGVILVTQPDGGAVSSLGTAAGLVAGFLIAVIAFQLRDLGRTEQAVSTVFWFSLFGTLLVAPLLPFYLQDHSVEQWLLILAIGTIGTLGQLLMTAALRYGAVASVIVMDYTALIWSTLFGWAIWNHLPPLATWLGAPAIVAAGLIVAWRERRLAKAEPPGVLIAPE